MMTEAKMIKPNKEKSPANRSREYFAAGPGDPGQGCALQTVSVEMGFPEGMLDECGRALGGDTLFLGSCAISSQDAQPTKPRERDRRGRRRRKSEPGRLLAGERRERAPD